ncbi:MAG: tRNA threonylcarbamoyladenosine dehydratase [Atribacterota bacterium]|nr:tRNA threonylcarbamoyladenosine dehydratase [Atribacterota bacterium]
MEDMLTRTRVLLGEEKVNKILKSKLVIFGVGGVGSYALEAVVRAGIKEVILIDYDTINITNLNRQLITTTENLGDLKVNAAAKRIKLINPDIKVTVFPEKVNEENVSDFIPLNTDYVIDAIDDIKGKTAIIKFCVENNIKIISSMGTGNRTMFKDYIITDISKTHGCPLARKLRKKLKENNIYSGVSVMFSPVTPDIVVKDKIIGSISFVPAQGGLKLAEKVINDIIQ